MTTRFDAKDQVNYSVPGVKSGYDGLNSDLYIPPCGIEDVDIALFNLFDKEIQVMVGGQDSTELKKVPVIFAAGEKWALLKKGKPIRDRSNTLILPIITVMRTEISQEVGSDIAGRGINQQTGEIVVRRRLDKTDRSYQNLINRLFIQNQQNAAVGSTKQQVANQLTTDREIGVLRDINSVQEGALLKSNLKNNIFETIVVPSPQFYTATYEVMIWTQYTQHMNQIMEKLLASLLPQAQSWKITTSKGYWFTAMIENGSFSSETNFDDMSTTERFIKQKFIVKVPAYIWATRSPGSPVPVKRYVSSPIITFDVGTERNGLENAQESSVKYDNYVLGSDDPTLPLDDRGNARDDQRRPGWRIQKVQPSNAEDAVDQNDPALTTIPRGRTPKKLKNGETVYTLTDITDGIFLIPVDKM